YRTWRLVHEAEVGQRQVIPCPDRTYRTRRTYRTWRLVHEAEVGQRRVVPCPCRTYRTRRTYRTSCSSGVCHRSEGVRALCRYVSMCATTFGLSAATFVVSPRSAARS